MAILNRCFVARILTGSLTFVFCAVGVRAQAHESMTPVLLAIEDAPVPFLGSDGRTHLVYELWLTNFSSGDVSVEKVDVLGDGNVVQSFDAAAIAERLQPAGRREPVDKLAGSMQSLLFLHVILAPGAEIPARLSHRVSIHADAAPPGQQEITETGGEVAVNRRAVAMIGPPLRGEGYVSADSCCDLARYQ